MELFLYEKLEYIFFYGCFFKYISLELRNDYSVGGTCIGDRCERKNKLW